MREKRVLFYMVSVIVLLICFISGMWIGDKHVYAQNETCISYELTSCVANGPHGECAPVCGTPDYVWTDKTFSGSTMEYGYRGSVYTAICMGPFTDGQPAE